jgi:hypothetical protein
MSERGNVAQRGEATLKAIVVVDASVSAYDLLARAVLAAITAALGYEDGQVRIKLDPS